MIGQRASHDAQRRVLCGPSVHQSVLANEALLRLLLAALALLRPTTAMVASVPSLAMRGSGYIGKPRLPGAERRRLRHRLHLANGNATTDYGSDSIDFDCEQRMRAVQRASPARSAQDDMSYLHGM